MKRFVLIVYLISLTLITKGQNLYESTTNPIELEFNNTNSGEGVFSVNYDSNNGKYRNYAIGSSIISGNADITLTPNTLSVDVSDYYNINYEITLTEPYEDTEIEVVFVETTTETVVLTYFIIIDYIEEEIDTQSPSVPANFRIANTTINSVSLKWDASSDNVGVKDYQIYNGSSHLKNETGLSYTVTGLSEGINYTFKVRARDNANNTSGFASISAQIDLSPPTAPSNVQSTQTTHNSISLTWSPASDNVGVKEYLVYKNGVLVNTISETSCTVTGLSECTEYFFEIKAKDAAGNISEAATLIASTISSTPVTISFNTNKTREVVFEAKAQEIIYFKEGFRFSTPSTSHIMTTTLGGGCSSGKTMTTKAKQDEINTNNETELKENFLENNFSYYPNPTDGLFNIKVNGNQSYSYSIISINGRIIKQEKNKNGISKVDMRNEPGGLYLIKLSTSNGEAIQKKIIKVQ